MDIGYIESSKACKILQKEVIYTQKQLGCNKKVALLKIASVKKVSNQKGMAAI